VLVIAVLNLCSLVGGDNSGLDSAIDSGTFCAGNKRKINQISRIVIAAYELKLMAAIIALSFENKARLGINSIEISRKVLSKGWNKG
jgi:hypothetical protein